MRGKFTVSKTNWIISFQFPERHFRFPRILCRSVPPSRMTYPVCLYSWSGFFFLRFLNPSVWPNAQISSIYSSLQHSWLLAANIISQMSRHEASTVSLSTHDQALISINTRIVHVRYIKILTWLRGFLVIFFVWFSLSSSILWELRDYELLIRGKFEILSRKP